MKKKNLSHILLSALLALALLAGCAAPTNNDPAPADPEPEATQPEEQPQPSAEPEAPAVANSDSYTDLVFAEVESGPIVGFNYKGVNTFRGIPYATAKRFQAPEKPEPWADVRPCFNWGKVSYSGQNGPTDVKFTEFITPSDNSWIQSDDCQNVNIWTPSMNAGDKLPVLVFLHGGDGNAQELVYYDGNSLASSGNLVFVTMNHREGLLGGVDLSAYGEEYAQSAYTEYLDIYAGLQWVKDNITNFGGNPDNITLMGQSAGAYNVMDIMGIPAFEGMYQRTVLDSYPVIAEHDTTTKEDTQANGAALMDALGLTAETISQIDELPYETLRDAASETGVRGGYMPTGEYFMDNPFTADGEIEANQSKPMMISCTYAETTDNFAGQILGYGYDEFHRPEVNEEKVRELLEARYGENTDKVLEMYEVAYPDRDPFYALYITTMRAAGNIYDVADLRAANGGAPVYVAVYSYCYPLFGGMVPVHTAGDLPLIFNNVDTVPEHIAGDEEMAHKVASEASSALANFCRTGDPNGEGVPNWPAFEGEQGTTMFFDRTSEARSGYADRDLLAFMRESRIDQ